MTDKELCKWLREHSSGIYRTSELGADRIEELLGQIAGIEKIVLEVLLNYDNLDPYFSTLAIQDFPNVAREVAERLKK
jgi:hypothetical protein